MSSYILRCPTCKGIPELELESGNASMANLRCRVRCCLFDISGPKCMTMEKAIMGAIDNWNKCIGKM